jgi:hypothetical protein
MDGFTGQVKRQARRAASAERFVRLLVGGGLSLVAGLWLTTLSAWGSAAWVGGVALATLGVAGLGAGIWHEVEP